MAEMRVLPDESDLVELTATQTGTGANGRKLGGANVAGATSALTTMQDAATATGNGTALSVTGHGAVAIQVTGTFVATVTFEGTADGTNYVSLPAMNVATGAVATTATAAGIYVVSAMGLSNVRARVSAYTSGSVTAKGRAIGLANPLPYVTVSGSSLTGATAIETQGNVDHDGPDSGKPIKVGGKALTGVPTAVANGDRVDAWMTGEGALVVAPRLTSNGLVASASGVGDGTTGSSVPPSALLAFNSASWDRLRSLGDDLDGVATSALGRLVVLGRKSGFNGVTWDRVRVANTYKEARPAAVASTGVSTLWTPAAGKKLRLMGFSIGASVTGSVHLRMGTAGAGAIVVSLYLIANQSLFVDMGQGRLAPAANDVLELYNNTAGAATYAFTGWGTEE